MIFEFSDYSEWLKAEVEQKIADNPLLSRTSFAKKLGLSQSYFSLVLSRKRALTEKRAEQIADRLGMSDHERRYLHLLVKRQKLKDASLRRLLDSEIDRFRREQQVTEIDIEKFKVISDWYYSAILELITIAGVDHSHQTLARRLGLVESVVDDAVARLMALGFIRKSGRRYERIDESTLQTPTEVLSAGLRTFHKQILKKAMTSLESQPLERRHFSGVTMAVDPVKLPEAKRRIMEFSRELMAFLEQGERSEVFQLSIQLFSLEEPAKE